MNRRHLLLSAGAAAALPLARPALAASRTRWVVQESEGFDALAFLGPLSGKPLYVSRYEAELAAFSPRVSPAARAALTALQQQADAAGKLLWPTLANVLSYGRTDRLSDLVAAVDAPDARLRAAYRASTHWDEVSWALYVEGRGHLRRVLAGLLDADFPAYREQLLRERLRARVPSLSAGLARYDVIGEQERLLGRTLDGRIGVVLLWFSKPHGVSVEGQRFLSHVDYADEAVVRNAAHEMLHPPFPMDGPAARAALGVLNRDPLLVRILKEHDPAFGYNSMEGILNEDTVEALDQIVSERLGVARDPAARWTKADGGMHVLAAALYGMLKAEGYDRSGGDIAAWITEAAGAGKLAPQRIQSAAAQVMKTTPDRLWPRPA